MTSALRLRRSSVLPRNRYATVVLTRRGAEVAAWPLLGTARPDLAVVDELARLQVVARRLGGAIRLRGACAELLELIELTGLRDVLVGVDEVVVPDDPVP